MTEGAKPGAPRGDPAEREPAKAEFAKAAAGAARATAVAAGVFVALVAAMLAGDHVRGTRLDPLEPPAEYVAAKKAVVGRAEGPEAEKLKDDLRLRIRELDARIRAEALRRDRFRRAGAWLLLAGAIVLVAALQIAASLAKRLPRPEGEPAPPEAALVTASRARWAVGVAGAAIAAVAVLVALAPGPAPDGAAAPPGDGGEAVAKPGPTDGERAAVTDDHPSAAEVARNWPRFRGPRGDGVSPYSNIPTSWDEKGGENVLWRTELELDGASSPVVWGERVFVSGGTAKRHAVHCIDAASGKVLWTGELEGVPEGPAEEPKVYAPSGHAAPTPATDGRRVYAIYANGDIGAFDYQGKQVWARALGLPDNSYGFAQSLAMWRSLVIVQFDQTGDKGPPSALHALDNATGRTVWETEREVDKSWASPIVVSAEKGDLIVTSAVPYVIAYEPATGKELWRADVLGGELAPSPILAGGLVIAVMSGPGMTAIRPGGEGDVTDTHAAWVNENGAFPDTSSPVSDGERVYTITSEGLVSCVSMKDGATLWEHDFEMNTYVSPSLVGDRVYVMGQGGEGFVFAAADEYREIGRGKLEGELSASPAFADGRMFVRSDKALYCIGEKREK